MNLLNFGIILMGLGIFLMGFGIGLHIGVNYPEIDNYHIAVVKNVDK